eukprot:TRINITY_DN249_c0_g1_i2.p1 TRINITY_DN249_c0_g1~~TRINITY_DN249_c0_g1_i2.p1  ORF type:complete len:216 (+),score=104.67 TRINITY_DN249_c0_g1_i2:62-709(+)
MRVMAIAFAAAACAAGASAAFTPPWFCHGIDCPVFVAERNISVGNTTLEVRTYQAKQQWTSTVVANTDLTTADDEAFHKLFDYISGSNVREEKVAMTSPVRTFVQGLHTTNFTVSFYVPYTLQPVLTPGTQGAPKPTDPTVFSAEDTEALTVAVVPFPGFANDKEIIGYAAALSGMLAQAGVEFDQENWYFSAYDPPFRLANRHNEVWIQLKNYN